MTLNAVQAERNAEPSLKRKEKRMSLDANATKLTKSGTVTISPHAQNGVQIVYEGFEGDGCSCRDVAVMAGLWAIGELQREIMRDVQTPGGGVTAVD